VFDGGAARLPGPAPPLSLTGPTAHVYAFAAKAVTKRMLHSLGGFYPYFEALEPRDDFSGGFSRLSRHLAEAVDETAVVEARRRHFAALTRLLDGASFVFDALPAGVCPLFLPLRVSGRDELMRQLRRAGVETFRFGAVPHALLPPVAAREAAALRDEILCLPVHQDLSDAQVARIGSLVRDSLVSPAR
jgi:hypothetical protein